MFAAPTAAIWVCNCMWHTLQQFWGAPTWLAGMRSPICTNPSSLLPSLHCKRAHLAPHLCMAATQADQAFQREQHTHLMPPHCPCVLQVKLGVPLFVPNGQIGLFGAVTQFKSLIKTRTAHLDVAAAGPALGCLASAALFLAGLTLSRGASQVGGLQFD